jgi:hypothetical protein
MPPKERLKKMKFNFSQKQTSRREMLRGSATLAGSAFPSAFFPHEVAPRFRGGIRGISTFASRPAREYARKVQRRSNANAKAC